MLDSHPTPIISKIMNWAPVVDVIISGMTSILMEMIAG
jgi:hypothetical protein